MREGKGTYYWRTGEEMEATWRANRINGEVKFNIEENKIELQAINGQLVA